MKHLSAKEVRLLFLAPPDDRAMLRIWEKFSLLRDTGKSHTLSKSHRLRKSEKCHVVVHSISVVVRMENALLDDVLALTLLLHHQVMLAHPDHQVLAHTVCSRENPLGMDERPLVLVFQMNSYKLCMP